MTSKKERIQRKQYERILRVLARSLSSEDSSERDRTITNERLEIYLRALNISERELTISLNDLYDYAIRDRRFHLYKLEELPVKGWRRLWKPPAKNGKVNDLSNKNQDKWLTRCSFFIPKKIREAWLGDLFEDRKEMRANGETRFRIAMATASQILSIALANPKLWLIALGAWLLSKVRNWFA